MFTKPNERSDDYEGRKHFGQAGSPDATHEFTNGAWMQLRPDVAPAPENMTEVADQHEAQIPGIEAISDIPDSPHKEGDIPLEYSVQNFNALVAANTAMQTALADAEMRFADISVHLETRVSENLHLREVIRDSMRPTIESLQKVTEDQETEARRLKKLNEGLNADLTFANAQRETLQRRLDRSLGYIDRFLDDEEAVHAPTAQSVPAPRPDVGPALGMIPDAVRPGRDEDRWHATASVISSDRGRHRRY